MRFRHVRGRRVQAKGGRAAGAVAVSRHGQSQDPVCVKFRPAFCRSPSRAETKAERSDAGWEPMKYEEDEINWGAADKLRRAGSK